MIFEYDIENEDGTVFDTLDCEACFYGAKGEKPEVDRLVVKRGKRVLTDTEINFYYGLGTYEAIAQYALDNVNRTLEGEP